MTTLGHFQFWYANCAIPGASIMPHSPQCKGDRKSHNSSTVAAPLTSEGMKNGILLSAMINPAEMEWLCSNRLMMSIVASMAIGTKVVSLLMIVNAQSPANIHTIPPSR